MFTLLHERKRQRRRHQTCRSTRAWRLHGAGRPVSSAEVDGALRIGNARALGRQDGPWGSLGGEGTGRQGPVRPGDADAAWRRVTRHAASERWPLLRLAGRDVQEASC